MHPNPEWLTKLPNLPEINDNIKFFGGHQQSVKYNWSVDWECHHAFEIMLIVSGVQQTKLRNREYVFKAEDIILIPPGLDHKNSCISKEGLTYFCVHFDIDNSEIQHHLLKNFNILLNRESPAYGKIKKILYAYIDLLHLKNYSLKQQLIVEKLFFELTIALIDYADYVNNQVKDSSNDILILAKTIADTIQYRFRKFTSDPMDRYRNLLSLEDIAFSLNISESTMLKTFKKVYFISPKQYIDQLRYNESKYLLSQHSLKISNISEIVGYQNVSHFSRQFKSWSHLSPREYRQKIDKN